MAKISRHLFVVIFLTLLFFTGTAQTLPRNSRTDTYRVYDTVIARMFAGDKVTFDTQASVDQLVIREQTITEFAYGEKKENWQQVKYRLPELSDETIANFEANIVKVIKFRRSFDIRLKYLLLPQKEFIAIFGASRNYNSTDESWKTFYEKFPGSAGYIMLSNIGYNRARTQALVYFVHWCGTVCGTGHYILLKKTEAQWDIAGIGGIWIS